MEQQIEERVKGHLEKLIVEVVLPWSHYHSCNAGPAARIFPNVKDAESYADSDLDEIIHVNAYQASRAAAAFDLMCAAAWLPNQQPNERDEYADMYAYGNRIIQEVRLLAATDGETISLLPGGRRTDKKLSDCTWATQGPGACG